MSQEQVRVENWLKWDDFHFNLSSYSKYSIHHFGREFGKEMMNTKKDG
jgi:hypothetical protein